jgi:hypothetical protein
VFLYFQKKGIEKRKPRFKASVFIKNALHKGDAGHLSSGHFFGAKRCKKPNYLDVKKYSGRC